MKQINQIILLFSLFITCLSHAMQWTPPTPLHRAAADGNLRKVRKLLDTGANVNASDNIDHTPLHEAVKNGHTNVVELLLKKGANVNDVTCHRYYVNCTSLFMAAAFGREAVVRLLLDAGANINSGDWTPLHKAAGKGHEAIVKLLLDAGAEVNTVIIYGLYGCHKLYGCHHIGETPLHRAAKKGREAVVNLLLDRGANVNADNENGWTSLHWAAIRGREAIARLLLDRGADVNAKDEFGRTPLHMAERNNNTELATLLRRWAFLKERQKKMYAFLMAINPRLGAESPANVLDTELFKRIWEFVKPTIEEADNFEENSEKHWPSQQELASQKPAQQEPQHQSAQQEVQSNWSWLNNVWFQGGAVASGIAVIGIFGYHLLFKRR